MADAALTRDVACRRYREGCFKEIVDAVAQEVHITVCLEGGRCCRLFASPAEPEELAVGHALLEMLPPNQVPVVTRADGLLFELATHSLTPRPIDPSLPRPLDGAALVGLMRRFIDAPGLWDGTGCFHRAALYDTLSGQFVARAEDIGRHNCVDRLAGRAFNQGMRLPELVLFLSCRVTASLMDKALRAGVRWIVSRSAVTEAALVAAREAGATLVGFARENEERCTVFTDALGKVTP